MSMTVSGITLNADTFKAAYPNWPHPEPPEERAMDDARLTHTAPAEATELGHDMAYRPGNQPRIDADRWECRRCGRIAYQAAGDAWGSATIAQCIAPEPED
jgi:hypothetical protein